MWLSKEASHPGILQEVQREKKHPPPPISPFHGQPQGHEQERVPASLPLTACHCASRQPHRRLIKVTAPGGLPDREPLRGTTRMSHPHTFIASQGPRTEATLSRNKAVR